MKIVDIFPQPVYQSEVEFTSEEVNFIHNARNSTYPNVYGNVTSNDNFVLNRKELSPLKKQIETHLDEYLTNVIGAGQVTLEVTQSWLNFNDKNTSHHTHWHNNSIISGVVYISEEPSELIFFKENVYGIKPKTIKATKFNQEAVPLTVKQNMIVLFPSHMSHGVNVNRKERARISLAFNSFYRGSLGDINKLTNLEL